MPFEKPAQEKPKKSAETSAELEPSPEVEEFNEQFDIYAEDLKNLNQELDELRLQPETPENKTRIEDIGGLIEMLQEQLEFDEEGEAAEGKLISFEELTEKEE